MNPQESTYYLGHCIGRDKEQLSIQVLSSSGSPLAILPNLWVIHPWVTITITFLLVVIVILCVFQATRGILEIVVAAKGDRRRALVSLGLAVGVLVLLFWAACWIFQELTRPRPIITSKTGKVLSPDYSLEWTYPDEQNGTVQYFVSIIDKETGNSVPPRLELLPNARVAQPGNMLVQVQAVAPDATKVNSEVAEVDWYHDSVERIQKTGELVVGIHADNSEGLFCFRTATLQPYDDRLSGERIGYDGFDIDLIKEIKKGLEGTLGLGPLKLKLVFVPWPDIIQRPNQFDVDFAIASISITPERAEQMLFSQAYWKSSMAILQPKSSVSQSDGETFSFDNFDEQTIGVHQGTTELDFIKRLKKDKPNLKFREARNNTELFAMLQSGEVTAVIYDYDRSWAEIKTHPNWISRKINYDDLTRHHIAVSQEEYGIVFAKVNNKLCAQVNRVLAEAGESHWDEKFNSRKEKLTH
jgi:ABC-type amino acid transport substrate-binding protein